MTILEWIQQVRPDVLQITKEIDGTFTWDEELPNQEQIQELANSYDPDAQYTEDQQKQIQRRKDYIRYKSRAAAKDGMLAEMAAGNMERVRNGIWTVEQLIGLTQDTELKQLLDDVNTLSFEIAYSRIDQMSNPLLTTEIKNIWKKLLSDNFYLEES